MHQDGSIAAINLSVAINGFVAIAVVSVAMAKVRCSSCKILLVNAWVCNGYRVFCAHEHDLQSALQAYGVSFHYILKRTWNFM